MGVCGGGKKAWGGGGGRRPTHYTLHPAPYAIHPTPYALHPTSYTVDTLLVTTQTRAERCATARGAPRLNPAACGCAQAVPRNPQTGIAPKPTDRHCPETHRQDCPENHRQALPRKPQTGIAPKPTDRLCPETHRQALPRNLCLRAPACLRLQVLQFYRGLSMPQPESLPARTCRCCSSTAACPCRTLSAHRCCWWTLSR